MARLLSSRSTFILKYIVPLSWIGGFGVLTLLLFIAPQHFLSQSGDPLPEWVNYLFLATWILGAILGVATAIPIKRVFLDGNRLVVSNFRRDARIPLSDIATVTQGHWIQLHPICLTFRNRTPFGRRVQFVPRVRSRFKENPIVEELRALSTTKDSQQQYMSASPTLGISALRAASATAPARTPGSHQG